MTLSIDTTPVVIAPPGPPGRSPLRYDTAVPRQLVHRSAISEVFVTDSVQVAPGRVDVAAQLPRGHVVAEHADRYEPLLLIEAVRQAGVVVAHRHLGVEPGVPFIFRGIDFQVTDLAGTRIGPRPGHAVFHLDVDPQVSGAGRLQGLTFSGHGTIDGVRCLSGAGRLVFLTPVAYTALRRRSRAAVAPSPGEDGATAAALPALTPARAATVGRRDRRNVVVTEPVPLADGALRAQVVVDVTHPHLFDHELDHIPGNLELEACRQLAVAAVSRTYGIDARALTMVTCRGDLTTFAELDLLTTVVATPGELAFRPSLRRHVCPVAVEVRQAGGVVATATVEVAA